ncbi:MAG: hypothetical protein B7Z81_10800 [Acidocella sp. 20-61-6]|nr:MAG: hypothetical protein B7Z81_10800 [Acidocella sp. 20-61-6]
MPPKNALKRSLIALLRGIKPAEMLALRAYGREWPITASIAGFSSDGSLVEWAKWELMYLFSVEVGNK